MPDFLPVSRAGALAVGTLLAASLSAAGAGAAPVTRTFGVTGAAQTWTVPPTVTSVALDLRGAGGGTIEGSSDVGGPGGRTQARLPVTPGQVLRIFVGAPGWMLEHEELNGWNGGGPAERQTCMNWVFPGGGASDVRVGGDGLADRILVAGGGGGAGHGSGGAGGGAVGGDATNGDTRAGGGTAVAGGTTTPGPDGLLAIAGGDGVFGAGGAGARAPTLSDCGGGGGGGWNGGAGGALLSGSPFGTGGGGGSGYVAPGIDGTTVAGGGPGPNGAGSVAVTFEGDDADPIPTIQSPSPGSSFPLYSGERVRYSCAPGAGASAIVSCTGRLRGEGVDAPVADGDVVPVVFEGAYQLTVTAVAAAGNIATTTGAFRALPGADDVSPTASITSPADRAVLPADHTVRSAFSCADEPGGSGLWPGRACLARLTRPDGTVVPIDTDSPLPTAPGAYELTVVATDNFDNAGTARRTFRVTPPPGTSDSSPPGPGTDGGPVPGPVPRPGGGGGRPGTAPPTVPPCSVRGLRLLGVEATGPARRPRVRVVGAAAASLTGRTVELRRGDRRVARATVAADGTVTATATAPRTAAARRRARYRLVLASTRSNAAGTDGTLSVLSHRRGPDGSLTLRGRVSPARRRTLALTTETLCGARIGAARSARTDRKGRFTATFPPVDGPPVVHRVGRGASAVAVLVRAG